MQASSLTERRRSRTYPAWGCHASPVLKTGWATGPGPLRAPGYHRPRLRLNALSWDTPQVGWRFRRTKNLLPGVPLNLGKRGASVSVGRRGARVTAGRRGLTATASLVGTGLAYVWRRSRRKS